MIEGPSQTSRQVISSVIDCTVYALQVVITDTAAVAGDDSAGFNTLPNRHGEAPQFS